MPPNPRRRALLADAGLDVLADVGARSLTHRAVDRAADLPLGTASNYFPTRRALLAALGDRIFERLAPSDAQLSELEAPEPTLAAFSRYLRHLLGRTTSEPDLVLALFELRLEARRHPELAEVLTQTLHRNFLADVAFSHAAGFPVTDDDIALLHYAVDGLLLDLLTTSIGHQQAPDDIVDDLVDRLVGRRFD